MYKNIITGIIIPVIIFYLYVYNITYNFTLNGKIICIMILYIYLYRGWVYYKIYRLPFKAVYIFIYIFFKRNRELYLTKNPTISRGWWWLYIF